MDYYVSEQERIKQEIDYATEQVAKLKKSYIYTGVFFNYNELQDLVDKITQTRLFRSIENPHVTFAFRPSRINPALLGQMATFEIIGYACDGKNQGVQVYMKESSSAELMHEFNLIQNPHITISVAEDGKPVDTGKMTFKPLPEPLTIKGKYGGFIGGGLYEGRKIIPAQIVFNND